ncbi:DNA topoisomerase IB [Paracoccus aestuariivivens]|uniref:DNA topoisomerase n=1 Tax=Paracoccus aestuariivivens TaxID=1820333 RepID=A0A6L6JGD9_9RHOB|nr:DNA topoisomerase IB [Paracoccus aestuariivivens]MTH79194.1 DNA topoisomerase IB [Paracoccus aestuariivivens]
MPAQLVFVSDSEPGISRRRVGKGFSYLGPAGETLDREEIARIKALAVPPAYYDVWICSLPDGHLQATGRDERGRKQYRYHPLWSETQSRTKYHQLVAFAEALPVLRRRLRRDLQGNVGDRTFSLAALVLLIDRTCLRIGNVAYTAANRSFGASTLLTRHLGLNEKGVIQLKFRAKGGKLCRHVLRDKRLNRILQEIGDLPGRNLFTYLDEDGLPHNVHSQDVNSYLAEVAGEGVTAKTFRTWGGTLAAFELADQLAPDACLTPRMLANAAAERLFNTPTVCRKSYIHSAVLELAALSPAERSTVLTGITCPEITDLRASERRLLAFLQKN